MRSQLKSALLLSLLLWLLLVVGYTMVVTLWAKVAAPDRGTGARLHGQKGLAENAFVQIGQDFRSSRYFWPRPSAVSYNAAASGGSNKGPSNPEYLHTLRARLDTFLHHHPYAKPADVPAELLTASGSGLDPHLSPAAALIQAERVALARNLPPDIVRELIHIHTESPFLGLFGPSKVHVLRLNIAIDAL